ncbi:M23 family metallopeptidase [Glutamicibacter sp.]|uniref:M23 family metallopeptidase n=1 Tax=Glutamicibacter sp. TaxID=1931995 RepID=UPI0028BDE9DE|nr:M23 family metallopeptidase [Glutamicibacter sp.]
MSSQRTLELSYPFSGRWLVQNSPANRVPSHGAALFASSFAIDFVPVDEQGRSAPMTLASFLKPESPAHFVGYGRPIFSPCAGRVIAVENSLADHPAYRGIPSLKYALTQRERAAAGWKALAGNHIMIQTDEAIVALCHLQQHSVPFEAGEELSAGETVGACGNSGNSTEPHLHLQAFTALPIASAQGLPVRFGESVPRNGTLVGDDK